MYQDGLLTVGLLISLLFLYGFVIYPLLRVLGVGFSPEALPLYARFLQQPETGRVILNTIGVGLSVASLGTILAFMLVFMQVKVDVPLKRFFHLITILPVIAPPFVMAMSIITLFGRSGIITKRLLGIRYDIYGAEGLIFALTLSFLPIAYLSLLGMMRALDPSLDEAATNLGAGRWLILRKITIPLLLPGFASSFLLLFVLAISDLGNPLLLGGSFNVLSTSIYLAIVGQFDLTAGAVLAVLLMIPSMAIFFFQHYWLSKRSYVTITGKPTGRPQLITSPEVKWPLFIANGLIIGLILLLYVNILVGAFTKVWGINFTPTLDHFYFVLSGYGSEAILDTIFLAGIATPIAGLGGILIAFLVVRRQFFGRALIDLTSMLGAAVPGIIVGIGLVLAYNQSHLAGLVPKLTGTAFIIVMAFTVRCIPAAVRGGVAALQQIDTSMEEAALSLGASPTTTFRKITLALIRPAFFAGLIWGFAHSMTSLSPIIFLVTPEWRIMTAQILNEAEAGRFGNAAAYSVVLILIVLTAIGLLQVTVGSSTGAERV
ncbi:iron ABC transporter permease [Anaerolineales bacterium HSG25]|nr:iron ABC transporter permease [Anaerolineales bacterium HSG25]